MLIKGLPTSSDGQTKAHFPPPVGTFGRRQTDEKESHDDAVCAQIGSSKIGQRVHPPAPRTWPDPAVYAARRHESRNGLIMMGMIPRALSCKSATCMDVVGGMRSSGVIVRCQLDVGFHEVMSCRCALSVAARAPRSLKG